MAKPPKALGGKASRRVRDSAGRAGGDQWKAEAAKEPALPPQRGPRRSGADPFGTTRSTRDRRLSLVVPPDAAAGRLAGLKRLLQVGLEGSWDLPQALGVTRRGRWRWRLPACRCTVGLRYAAEDLDREPQPVLALSSPGGDGAGAGAVRLALLPAPALSVSRPVGGVGAVEVGVEQGPHGGGLQGTAGVRFRPLGFLRLGRLPRCVGSLAPELRVVDLAGPGRRLEVVARLDHAFTLHPEEPARPPTARDRRLGAGDSDLVLAAGHYIDAGVYVGAPGEKETNMRVVNLVDAELRRRGWKVSRPDLTKQDLSWLAYQNWMAQRTRAGVPIVEIHGQGKAARPGLPVVGVVGSAEAPLTAPLGDMFGQMPNDPRELAVPRNGGALVEAYDTDHMWSLSGREKSLEVQRLGLGLVRVLHRHLWKDSKAPTARTGCSSTGCVL